MLKDKRGYRTHLDPVPADGDVRRGQIQPDARVSCCRDVAVLNQDIRGVLCEDNPVPEAFWRVVAARFRE